MNHTGTILCLSLAERWVRGGYKALQLVALVVHPADSFKIKHYYWASIGHLSQEITAINARGKQLNHQKSMDSACQKHMAVGSKPRASTPVKISKAFTGERLASFPGTFFG